MCLVVLANGGRISVRQDFPCAGAPKEWSQGCGLWAYLRGSWVDTCGFHWPGKGSGLVTVQGYTTGNFQIGAN